MKQKLLLIVFYLTTTYLHAQINSRLMIVDNAGNTYEVDPKTCSSSPLNECTGGNPIFSIALIGNTVYYTDINGKLYSYTLNSQQDL